MYFDEKNWEICLFGPVLNLDFSDSFDMHIKNYKKNKNGPQL